MPGTKKRVIIYRGGDDVFYQSIFPIVASATQFQICKNLRNTFIHFTKSVSFFLITSDPCKKTTTITIELNKDYFNLCFSKNCSWLNCFSNKSPALRLLVIILKEHSASLRGICLKLWYMFERFSKFNLEYNFISNRKNSKRNSISQNFKAILAKLEYASLAS